MINCTKKKIYKILMISIVIVISATLLLASGVLANTQTTGPIA